MYAVYIAIIIVLDFCELKKKTQTLYSTVCMKVSSLENFLLYGISPKLSPEAILPQR